MAELDLETLEELLKVIIKSSYNSSKKKRLRNMKILRKEIRMKITIDLRSQNQDQDRRATRKSLINTIRIRRTRKESELIARVMDQRVKKRKRKT